MQWRMALLSWDHTCLAIPEEVSRPSEFRQPLWFPVTATSVTMMAIALGLGHEKREKREKGEFPPLCLSIRRPFQTPFLIWTALSVPAGAHSHPPIQPGDTRRQKMLNSYQSFLPIFLRLFTLNSSQKLLHGFCPGLIAAFYGREESRVCLLHLNGNMNL